MRWVYDGFRETYVKIGVSFDKNYYESETYLVGKKYVLEGVKKGLFVTESDSSIWVDLTDFNLDKKILLRSDGTAVYITQDLGTAILRYQDFSFNKMIYTVGNEQNYHFDVLFKILDKMKCEWASDLVHLSYGMVTFPEGKMKSREGTVVDIDDLFEEMCQKANSIILKSDKSAEFGAELNNKEFLEKLSIMIGDAALKYFILKTDAKKTCYLTLKNLLILMNHTGPFIQYTYARIKSILCHSESGFSV